MIPARDVGLDETTRSRILEEQHKIRIDASLTKEERYNASDITSELLGLPVLDKSLVHPACDFHEMCSPYMLEAYAHDLRCPMGGVKQGYRAQFIVNGVNAAERQRMIEQSPYREGFEEFSVTENRMVIIEDAIGISADAPLWTSRARLRSSWVYDLQANFRPR